MNLLIWVIPIAKLGFCIFVVYVGIQVLLSKKKIVELEQRIQDSNQLQNDQLNKALGVIIESFSNSNLKVKSASLLVAQLYLYCSRNIDSKVYFFVDPYHQQAVMLRDNNGRIKQAVSIPDSSTTLVYKEIEKEYDEKGVVSLIFLDSLIEKIYTNTIKDDKF